VWNNLATQSLREEHRRRSQPVLCVNASAIPKSAWSGLYVIPGVALGAALARIAAILSRNTVDPRIEAINRDLDNRWDPGALAVPADLVVVADMRPITQTARVFGTLADAHEGSEADAFRANLLALTASEGWTRLVAEDGDSREVTTKTTLARVRRGDARLLLLRGYVNAWLASLVLAPTFSISDLRVDRLLERLDVIAGAG
jgi:hypothetical protein